VFIGGFARSDEVGTREGRDEITNKNKAKVGKIILNTDLIRADKNLFAIYQTMYSNADIEIWYDWDRRLNDTTWTDQCYFLTLDGKKIGGAVITDDKIMFPFLIAPFYDRITFWSWLLKHSPKSKISGVLDEDSSILLMFSYKAIDTNQVMCRPADNVDVVLPDGFFCRPFDMEKEADEIGNAILKGYRGGIDSDIHGEATLEYAIEDARRVIKIYAPKDLSHVLVEATTNQIVGVCIAGVGENYTHGYAEIADICVLPEYRGRGLAKYMISRIVTQAHGVAPFVKLFVTIGNNSEYVYRQMGFIAGPRFTNMERR